MNRIKHIVVAVFMAGATALTAAPSIAAPLAGAYEHQAHVPLNRIIAQMERDLGGKFMSADYDDSAEVYRIIWRMPNGSMQQYTADAGSGNYRRVGGEAR